MLAPLWTAWGLKGLAYAGILLLLAVLWRRAAVQAEKYKAECRDLQVNLGQACETITEQGKAVWQWREAANDAAAKLIAAQEDAARVRKQFDQLAEKLRTAEIPVDAEGALAWMAEVAHELASQVGR